MEVNYNEIISNQIEFDFNDDYDDDYSLSLDEQIPSLMIT